jgi:hypothetical protein
MTRVVKAMADCSDQQPKFVHRLKIPGEDGSGDQPCNAVGNVCRVFPIMIRVLPVSLTGFFNKLAKARPVGTDACWERLHVHQRQDMLNKHLAVAPKQNSR